MVLKIEPGIKLNLSSVFSFGHFYEVLCRTDVNSDSK